MGRHERFWMWRPRSLSTGLGGHHRGPAVAALLMAGMVGPTVLPGAAGGQQPEGPTAETDGSTPRGPTSRQPTILGALAGYATSEGMWKPEAESSRIGGVLLGGFVDAATPVPWFSVRGEILWSQRGDDVTVTVEGVPAMGGTRLDYLTVSLRPRMSVVLGPVRLHVAAGPVVEQSVRSRFDPTLAPLVAAPATTFGVLAGAGIGTTIAGGRRVEVEARHVEGLSDAVQGAFVSMRNRSFEVVVRVGVPLPER